MLVLISSCSTPEKISGDNSSNNKETRVISLTDDFVPYFKASTKDQRCNALQKWYEHGVILGGSNTFGRTRTTNITVTKSFAPAFLDDVFPLYFAAQYRDINPEKGKQIHHDITTCNTPIIGTRSKVIGAAFIWKPNSRDFWIKFIDAERNRSLHEKYAALPERATLAPVIHSSGKAPGPFDSENRRYSRVIHSDDRLTIGKLNDHVKKCTRNISYIVNIDLAPDEPITPALSKDIMEQVLLPLARRECPGAELTIDASIYSRRFSVTHKGEVVPAGSVKIYNESELADISYSLANQQQETDPTIYYGGIDYNWPELASINGLADYKKNGRRNTTMAERYSPKRTVRYVNYKPSDTPEYLKNTVNGELIQQIADRDFLGIYRKGLDIDLSALPNREVDSLSILYTKLTGGEELSLTGDAMAPRKTWFCVGCTSL